MKIIQEFKDFALKGNVMDLAIGVIIGSAFSKIVSSLVTDIISPPLSLLTGKIDFNNLYVNISGSHFASLAEAKAAGAQVITYGAFINAAIEFILVAFVLFLIIKQINRFKRPQDPTTKECVHCCSVVPIKAVRCPHCTQEIPLN